MSRILVVEDEQHIADGLRFNLEAEGHEVDVAGDGEQALDLLLDERHAFDVVVLDVMLPGQGRLRRRAGAARRRPVRADPDADRARPARRRAARASRPAPTTTCRSRSSWRSCMARVRGLLRRRRWNEREPAERAARRRADVYTFAGRTLDFARDGAAGARQVVSADADGVRPAALSRDATPGSRCRAAPSSKTSGACTRSTDTRAIDNFIVRLRRYLEDRPGSPKFLLTVRGVGYKFVPDAEVGRSTSEARTFRRGLLANLRRRARYVPDSCDQHAGGRRHVPLLLRFVGLRRRAHDRRSA